MKVYKATNLSVNLFFKTERFRVNKKALKQCVKSVLTCLKIENAEISFCFVCNQYMRKLNEEYKGRYVFTDVLAFPLHEKVKDKQGAFLTLLGEVIISLDQTKSNANRFGNSFDDELYLYVIHGILHVLGYEDTSAKKKKIMFALQNELFNKIITN